MLFHSVNRYRAIHGIAIQSHPAQAQRRRMNARECERRRRVTIQTRHHTHIHTYPISFCHLHKFILGVNSSMKIKSLKINKKYIKWKIKKSKWNKCHGQLSENEIDDVGRADDSVDCNVRIGNEQEREKQRMSRKKWTTSALNTIFWNEKPKRKSR